MSKKEHKQSKNPVTEEPTDQTTETEQAKAQTEETAEAQTEEKTEPQAAEPEAQQAEQSDACEQLQAKLAAEHDQFLRLAAEYDNFRKRSRKEREDLYTTIRAETVAKFLPVFDDLERALHNETVDEAYKKGVELTMTELRKIMTGLGVEEFGEVGDTFDPNAHNAVMHVEDESLGENTLAQIFQKGFRIGEKVIRFAVVKVAN